MGTNLHQFAKKNGVKYFFVSFVDLFGVLRSKLVPATAIDEIQSEGAGFAGFAPGFAAGFACFAVGFVAGFASFAGFAL